MIDMLISTIILCAGFWLAVVGITGVLGNSFKAAGICLVQFCLALVGITTVAMRGVRLSILGRKPATLPPWTGRERESLQQDLDEAAKDFIGLPDMTWAEHKKRWPSLTPTGTGLEISQGHGLFPEALEAYLESQEQA